MQLPSLEELEAQVAIIKTQSLKEETVQRFLAIYLSATAKKIGLYIPSEIIIILLQNYLESSEMSLDLSLEKARKIHAEASKQT